MKIHEVYKSYNPDFSTGTISIWILILLQDILHTVRCLQYHSLYPLDASSTHAFNGGKISPGVGSWGGSEWVRSEWTGTVDMDSTLSDPKPWDPQEQGKAPSSVVRILRKCQTPPPDPSVDADSMYRKHPSWPSPSSRSWPQMASLPRLFLMYLCYSPCFLHLYVTTPPLCSAVINMLSL